jgi:glycosyltransferase involved in cell wall biosynthesis
VTAPLTVLVLDQGQGVWGAQRYLLRLAPLLRERGIELVLGGPSELELAAAWTEAGFEHTHVSLPTVRSVRRDGDTGPVSPRRLLGEAGSIPRTVRAIARTAKSIGADAVFANGHWTHLDAALAARFAGVPCVLHLHEEAVPGVGTKLREAAVALAAATIAVSQSVAGGLSDSLRRRVTVIPNGVDVDVLSPGPAPPGVREELGAGPHDVLAVALTRLDPVKRIEDVVAAVANGCADETLGLRLAVVGRTSAYPEYATNTQAAARAALGDRVVFAGARTDVEAVLRAADVLVHAGVVEGMPLGLLEAAACGCPVVAYDAAGVSEAVRDGKTGVVVPVGDVDALAQGVRMLSRDAGLRKAMGAAGREHVLAEHTLELQADSMAALTAAVVTARPRVAA